MHRICRSAQSYSPPKIDGQISGFHQGAAIAHFYVAASSDAEDALRLATGTMPLNELLC